MMNHKERVLTAINHAEPDRVPLDLMSTGTGLTDPTYKNLLSYLGLPDCVKPYKRYSNVNYYNERILEYYNIDFRSVRIDGTKKVLDQRLNKKGV